MSVMDRRVEERPRLGILQQQRHRCDLLAETHVFVGRCVKAAGGCGEFEAPQTQDEVFECAARATRRCSRPPETLVSFGAGNFSVNSRNSPPTVSVTRVITTVS